LEIWKDIAGYESYYQVSNYGRVKSLDRRIEHLNRLVKGRILKINNIKDHYSSVGLSKNHKVRTFWVHRLVANAFISNDNIFPEVNHIDGNKHNNSTNNLEWVTRSRNMNHAYETGLQVVKEGTKPPAKRGSDHYRSKLTEEDVLFIRTNYKPYDNEFGAKALGEKFNLHKNHIRDIVNRKSWKHVH
jgi:hypothetical protein